MSYELLLPRVHGLQIKYLSNLMSNHTIFVFFMCNVFLNFFKSFKNTDQTNSATIPWNISDASYFRQKIS